MKQNVKGSFLMLVIALVIIGIGYLVFFSVSDSIDGTSSANNLACDNVASFYSIYPPIIMVIAIVIILGFISYYISTPTRYLKTHKYLSKIVEFLDATTYYFAFGLLFFAICGVVAVAVYLLLTVISFAGESGAGIEIGKWALILIGAYFGIAGVGYLFKKFIWDKWKKTKEKAEYLKNMEELPGAI